MLLQLLLRLPHLRAVLRLLHRRVVRPHLRLLRAVLHLHRVEKHLPRHPAEIPVHPLPHRAEITERHLHLLRAVTTVHLPRHPAAKERELRHLLPADRVQEHLRLLRAADRVQAHRHLHRAADRARVHRLLHLHLRIVSATFRTEVTGNVMVVRVTTMTTTTSVTPQAGK